MTMTFDIADLAYHRIEHLRAENKDISIDKMLIENGDERRAVIIYTDYRFNLMGIDFIESNTSWKRESAVQEYNDLVKDGYCVVLYVPLEDKEEVAEMLRSKGGRSNIRVYSIERGLLKQKDTELGGNHHTPSGIPG